MLSANASVGSALNVVGARLNALSRRPYIDKDGNAYILQGRFNAQTGGYEVIGKLQVNATTALLQYDEWKDIDRVVLEAAVKRMRGIQDLRSAGLTHGLGSIGMMISLWDRQSDMTDADVNMSAVTQGEKDTLAYQPQFVPVPVFHKDFSLELRRLTASRQFGESLDVTGAQVAGRKVAEKMESVLFNGVSIQVTDPLLGAGTIYGYTTHPDRNIVDMSATWDSLTSSENINIITDVMAMMTASRTSRYYGPWVLYIPKNFEAKMDEDYRGSNSSDVRTVRQRILALEGIQDVRVADFLDDDNVVLISLQRDVVDLAMAQDVTTVQWSVTGGMVEEFKVMAVLVPRLKSDFDGRSGITHLRPVS